jgi:purine-binding chemotaxis protein CheW
VSEIKQYVTFHWNGKLYGIDIHLVNDVSPASTGIIPVPLSDLYIRGLVNIRGQVILVMDIGMVLGNKECFISPFSHIIILKTRSALTRVVGLDSDIDISAFSDKPVGFLVEIIGDVISIHEKEIDTESKYREKGNFNFISGVAKLGDQLLIILDPLKILNCGYEKTT